MGLLRWLLLGDELILKEIRIMTQALDNLTAKVESQSTVIASAETLLKTLADEIRNATGDDDALNALADKIDSQTSELSQAIAANTPADTSGQGAQPTGDQGTDQNAGNAGTGA